MKLYFTMREVCQMFNVSRPTIGRWEDPKSDDYCGFPQRVHLGPVHTSSNKLGGKKRSNCRIGFPVDEVDAWDAARKAARTAPSKEGLRLVTTS
jgi:predicted DNA-binding transcriptional regulator AlpA